MKYIAIVDDHRMVRKALGNLINAFPGYQMILDAGNGRELMARIDNECLPDIVLLDIIMAEMDGFSTAAWLRDHYPEVKILALTTLESESAILRMLRGGARGFLHKDADPDELKLAFEQISSIGYYYNEYVNRQTFRSVNLLHQDADTLVRLTDRERVFLQLACSEKTYQQIAAEMFVSERTVDGYRDSLFKKLGVTTRVGLALYAIKNQLVHI